MDSFNQVNQESFYLDRHNLTYVALENDQIVAMATLSNNNHLSLLFVLDSYQHLGIGTKLLEIIDNLVLGDLSVNSGIEAKDFYLKAGFELTDNLIKRMVFYIIQW
ncbi:GNAT family N-acetyltransferase [Coprobacillaceae bacterium CR2/5/TPMF4]|nr:GNAT family N-acetyltransferase [Coprobacillaceae bacterium CR2/5/TPMF4]